MPRRTASQRGSLLLSPFKECRVVLQSVQVQGLAIPGLFSHYPCLLLPSHIPSYCPGALGSRQSFSVSAARCFNPHALPASEARRCPHFIFSSSSGDLRSICLESCRGRWEEKIYPSLTGEIEPREAEVANSTEFTPDNWRPCPLVFSLAFLPR